MTPSKSNPLAEKAAAKSSAPKRTSVVKNAIAAASVEAAAKKASPAKSAKITKANKVLKSTKIGKVTVSPDFCADSHVDVSRNHLEWLVREEDAIVNAVMDEGSTVNLFDLSAKFKKDPLLVARHVLAGELPEMVGLLADPSSEEEAEFLGLVLGGAPISLAFKWCAATEDQDDRPTTDQIQCGLSRGDFRPAMNLVRSTGIWFSSADQLEYLVSLQDLDAQDIERAVAELHERIEPPTPQMVFEQLCGLFEGAPSVDWNSIGLLSSSASRGSYRTSSKNRSTTTVIKAGQSRTSKAGVAKTATRTSPSKRRRSGWASKSKRYSKRR